MLTITCDLQASVEHVIGCPDVIIVKLQQSVIFKKRRPPAVGISLQQTKSLLVTALQSWWYSHNSKCYNGVTEHDPLTSTAMDWFWRSQGRRCGWGRDASQYAVREASAPIPSREDVVREIEGRGREGRRLQRSSNSDPWRPAWERSDRNHSWKCIAKKRKSERKKNTHWEMRKLHGAYTVD